jgi:hypothetical protein
VLLAPSYGSSSEASASSIWCNLSCVAPDIFTEETKIFACDDSNMEHLKALEVLFSHTTQPGEMDSGMEISDVTIVIPMMVAQLTKYIAAHQISQCQASHADEQTERLKLWHICNYVNVLPTSIGGDIIVSGSNTTESDDLEDTQQLTAFVEAFQYSSSKIFLLSMMLPRLEKQNHVVLLICHSTELLLAIEDYCVVKNYPAILLSETASTGQRIDIPYLQRTSEEFFIYLLLAQDSGMAEIPAADTVICCDSSLDPEKDNKIDRIVASIRHRPRLDVYRLRSFGSVEYSVEDLEGSNQIPNDALRISDTLSPGDIATIMNTSAEAGSDEQNMDIHGGGGMPKSNLITSAWTKGSSTAFGGNKTVCRSRTIRIFGTEDDEVDRISTLSQTELIALQDAPVSSYQTSKCWQNLLFCCLCGHLDLVESKRTVETKYHNHRLVSCKLCPRALHRICFEQSSLPQKELVLEDNVCPQHICACGANVGVMCPCISCLTVYCANCLPEYEIESMGRHTETTKKCGYFSTSYRYIRCEYCAQIKCAKSMTETECDAAGFYYGTQSAASMDEGGSENGTGLSENRGGDSEDGALKTLTDSHPNFIRLPSQTVSCFGEELEISKKRKRSTFDEIDFAGKSSEGGSNSSKDDSKLCDDEMDGTLSLVVNLNVDGQQSCPAKKMNIEMTSTITFLDILKSLGDRDASYFDGMLYDIVVCAFLSKGYSSETQIDCSLEDEVIGAISLGYKYIRFAVQNKMSKMSK